MYIGDLVLRPRDVPQRHSDLSYSMCGTIVNH